MSRKKETPPDDIQDILDIARSVRKAISTFDLRDLFFNLKTLSIDLDDISYKAVADGREHDDFTNACIVVLVWEFLRKNIESIDKISSVHAELSEDL